MLARDEQLHLHLVGVAGRNLCAERRLQMVNGASMESATCCGAEFVIGLPTKPKSRLSFFFLALVGRWVGSRSNFWTRSRHFDGAPIRDDPVLGSDPFSLVR